jgi:23S rRNA (guanosine2251-2'-O)-methyltransferase
MARWIYGKHPVLERLRQPKEGLEYIVLVKGMNESDAKALLQAAKAAQVQVRWQNRGWLTEKLQSDKHQGVAAVSESFRYSELADLIEGAAEGSTFLALDGVEDVGNLGAILRGAEGAGVQGILIPRDRAAQVTPAVEKTSAGATAWLPIASVVNISRALEDLKGAGFWIYGLAGEAKESVYEQKFSGKICIVLGAEDKGLRPLVATHCDKLLKIPMAGKIASLNVSMAAGIVLFEVLRQRGVMESRPKRA